MTNPRLEYILQQLGPTLSSPVILNYDKGIFSCKRPVMEASTLDLNGAQVPLLSFDFQTAQSALSGIDALSRLTPVHVPYEETPLDDFLKQEYVVVFSPCTHGGSIIVLKEDERFTCCANGLTPSLERVQTYFSQTSPEEVSKQLKLFSEKGRKPRLFSEQEKPYLGITSRI